MADVQKSINVEITATDDASEPIKKVGKESKSSLSAVSRFGSGAANAFSKVGAAAVVFNQSLELMKKFKDAGMIAIEMTREFVDANDPLMKSFDDSSKTVKKLGANVGLVLIKAFNATVKAIEPIINSIQTWMVANQNLIGTNIIQWIESFAKGAIVVLAKGILLVSKITSGWGMIWAALKIAVNTFYSALLSGTAKALEKMASFADAIGMDGLAGKLKTASTAAKDFGQDFQDSADDATKELDGVIKAQESLEASVKKYGQAAHNAIGVIAVNAAKSLNTQTKIGNKTNEERAKQLEDQKEKEAAALALREANQKKIEAWEEKKRSFAEAEKSRLQSIAAEYGAVGNSIGAAFTSGFAAAEEGQNAVAEGMKSMFAQMIDLALEAMQKFVTIKAVEAAASAGAANAWGGPIFAAMAAGMMFGVIRGLVGMAFMARGGIVEGGVPGHDSVPIMAQAGEMVLSRDQVDRMRQDGGIGGGTINVTMNQQIPASKAELNKFVRQSIVPSLRDLKAQGMF